MSEGLRRVRIHGLCGGITLCGIRWPDAPKGDRWIASNGIFSDEITCLQCREVARIQGKAMFEMAAHEPVVDDESPLAAKQEASLIALAKRRAKKPIEPVEFLVPESIFGPLERYRLRQQRMLDMMESINAQKKEIARLERDLEIITDSMDKLWWELTNEERATLDKQVVPEETPAAKPEFDLMAELKKSLGKNP